MKVPTDSKYQQEWSLELLRKKMPRWIQQKGLRRCWPAEAREARAWAIENYPLKVHKGRKLIDFWQAQKGNNWEFRVVWYGIVPTTGTIMGCMGKARFKTLSYWDFSDKDDPKFWRFAAPVLVTERRIEEFRRGIAALKRLDHGNLEAEQAGIVQYKIPIALSEYGKRPTTINFSVERYVHCYSYRIHVFKEYPDKETGELVFKQTPRVFAWRKPQCKRAFAALDKLLSVMEELKKERDVVAKRKRLEAPEMEKLSIADEVLEEESRFIEDEL